VGKIREPPPIEARFTINEKLVEPALTSALAKFGHEALTRSMASAASE